MANDHNFSYILNTQKESNFDSDCIWWRKYAFWLITVWKNCSALSCDKRRDEQAQCPGKRKWSAFCTESWSTGKYGSVWLDQMALYSYLFHLLFKLSGNLRFYIKCFHINQIHRVSSFLLKVFISSQHNLVSDIYICGRKSGSKSLLNFSMSPKCLKRKFSSVEFLHCLWLPVALRGGKID